MPSSVPLVWVHGSDSQLASLVRDAAGRAFAGADVRDLATVGGAPAVANSARELLVLVDPAASLVAEAAAAKDGAALPRWAVVVLGEAPAGAKVWPANVVPREEWNVPLLARVLRSALALHGIEREQARCRGDLATFGFRIAHDLRTPLGGMLTTAEMLREILSEDAPDKAELTQPILDSAEGMVKLIERMSFIAKMAASREAPARLNMNLPFWNAFQRVEAEVLKARASFTYPSTWPDVIGHASWLEMLWRNLIDNALQHGGPAAKIEAGWEPKGDNVRYFVRDQGAVAPEKQSLLFHPFERLHEPGAPRGLGLAVARRLVELHGGTCGYEPGAAGGSVFYFELPAAKT